VLKDAEPNPYTLDLPLIFTVKIVLLSSGEQRLNGLTRIDTNL